MIANTNTIFNLCCAIAIFPTLPILEKLSCRIVKDDVVVENKYQDKLDALNPMFFDTPALALRSVYDALLTQLQAVRQNIEKSFGLLRDFDEKTYQEIMDEEANIDLLTDRISRYVVEFLPNLRGEGNAAILNEYYKVVTEFERLGDHAVNIADNAENLHKNNRSFTNAAFKEIEVLEELLGELLDYTETAFAKRDIEAAFCIEPLQQLVSEMVLRLKRHHLIRMGRGECDIFADSNFENLMSDLKRIADVSTNIGEAVLVRVNPELADDEHNYFTALRAGNDKKFNELYEEANHKYMGRIPTSSDLLKESLQESEGEDFSEVAD